MSLLLVLIGLLFLVQISLSDNPITNRRQLGCIESGFEKTNYSTYISRAFFIIAVLYVLFDIELILLLPRLFVLSEQALVYFSLLILLRIIIITLLLEWVWSGLKWSLLVLGVWRQGVGLEIKILIIWIIKNLPLLILEKWNIITREQFWK